jgi:putative hydrolase
MTDHGPALPGGPHPYHFHALRFVPPTLQGVRILRGIEANIIGPGELDLAVHSLDRLDLVMAGFHEDCGFRGRDLAENTAALIHLMERQRIHVLTHLGNPIFPIDAAIVVKRAAELGVAIEINNASFSISRKGSAENCRLMARLCAQFGTLVAISSDAHIAETVGVMEQALQAARESGIRWEQIVNRTLERTLAFLDLASD